jgi:Alkaline phosphatase PhoX
VTLLATTDADGNALPEFDGSTWDPWARRLLFTAEAGADGGVWAADLSVPAKVEDVSGAFGRGGYEGIQNESDGNLWIVEDAGGPNGAVNSDARQPNSFVFRYVPAWPGDLKNGKLQVLQMLNESGTPILFHSGQADADILSPDVKLLYTHGKSLQTRWITIHDTAVDGATPFDANAKAKELGGTPFKRPENRQFRPDGKFREFFFDATGDTNALTEAGSDYGGFAGVFKLTQKKPIRQHEDADALLQGRRDARRSRQRRLPDDE